MRRTLRSTQLHVLPGLTRLRDQHGVNLSLCTRCIAIKGKKKECLSINQLGGLSLLLACRKSVSRPPQAVHPRAMMGGRRLVTTYAPLVGWFDDVPSMG